MAIIIANDGNFTVDTIADRNAISKRYTGLRVFVKDATADPYFGGGSVQYIWDGVSLKWSPIWSSNKSELNFTTEEKVLVDGKVTADNNVKDNVLLSAVIINSQGNIASDAIPTVVGKEINLGTNAYDTMKLRYTYAYGSLSSMLDDIWSVKADKTYVDQKVATAITDADFATQAFVSAQIGAQDLITQDWVAAQGYTTQTWVTSQGYATESFVTSQNFTTLPLVQSWVNSQNYVTSSDLSNQYATYTWIGEQGYATETWISQQGFTTQSWVLTQGFATETFVNTAISNYPVKEAPTDGKQYARKDGAWAEVVVTLNSYSILSGSSTSGDYVVNATDQQSIAITATTTRNISFNNGPTGRTMTAALIMLGNKAPNVTGSNVKWNKNTAMTDADMNATKTVIVAFWDGIDTWILAKGLGY